MAANNLHLDAGRVPSEEEVGAALWDCYRFLIALGKRRRERLARQAAEAGQGSGANVQTGQGVQDARP